MGPFSFSHAENKPSGHFELETVSGSRTKHLLQQPYVGQNEQPPAMKPKPSHDISLNCTNPKPRGSPVVLLRMRMTSLRAPHFEKWVLSMSSVVCQVKPPRKILPSTSTSVITISFRTGQILSVPMNVYMQTVSRILETLISCSGSATQKV